MFGKLFNIGSSLITKAMANLNSFLDGMSAEELEKQAVAASMVLAKTTMSDGDCSDAEEAEVMAAIKDTKELSALPQSTLEESFVLWLGEDKLGAQSLRKKVKAKAEINELLGTLVGTPLAPALIPILCDIAAKDGKFQRCEADDILDSAKKMGVNPSSDLGLNISAMVNC